MWYWLNFVGFRFERFPKRPSIYWKIFVTNRIEQNGTFSINGMKLWNENFKSAKYLWNLKIWTVLYVTPENITIIDLGSKYQT